MKKTAQLFFILIFFFAAEFSFAQPERKFDFYSRGNYRANVPRPSEILRFDVGDLHTTYAQMESVVNAIAKASPDRVRVFDIGETNEHRMQHIVAISSPENILALDRIKADNARLTDPRVTSQAAANAIAEKNPAIAWLAYTIHGNESASFETMMQVVYQLAASEEPATLDILKNCVTLIITGENPDGHERFVSWYNSVGVGDPNPFALEHREPWSVYGRLSHYRFDLNRDALVTSQKESQNLQRAFLEWNPQVSADHHGQPSQFFFPPDALPINPNLPEPQFSRWNEVYGRANAAAFDRNKWDYYVRDIFDAFYPGYWDMYPSLNGAIGMTYETDGGGTKGLRYTRDDGTIATLRSAIAKHFVASMTTLETTAKHRAERLRDYYSFRADAMKNFASSKMKRIVILPGSDRVKAAELVEALTRARIEVKIAGDPFSSTTAHSYMEKNSPAERRTFPAGSYVIDLNQPQRILAKSLLEPDTPQDKAFVDDNLGRFNRNQMKGKRQPKEDFGFYDITAWSLPLAFGLDAYWTEDGGDTRGLLADVRSLVMAKAGEFPGRAEVSYIIPYETDTTSAMIIRLLQDDVRVNVATKTLNAGGKNWPTGTFVVRVSRNDESVHQKVEQLAKEMGVNVVPVNSGFADEGDTSVGGESVVSLHAPKIVVAADDGIDQTSFGSIWWTLDRFGITFTPMSIRSIRNGGLKDYNVLIIPDGSAGQIMGQFGTSGVSALKDWVDDGGTVVTVRGASVFATLKDVGLSSSRLVGSGDDEKTDATAAADAKPAAPANTATPAAAKPAPEPKVNPSSEQMANDLDDRLAGFVPPIVSPSADANKVPVPLPGSIMRATVDRTAYINYGVHQNELPVLLAGGYFFKYSKEGTNALVFASNSKAPLTISGFVWPGNTERLLAGTSYLIDEPHGGGHAILFAEEPFFRGVFRSTTRQFFNAIAFNGAF